MRASSSSGVTRCVGQIGKTCFSGHRARFSEAAPQAAKVAHAIAARRAALNTGDAVCCCGIDKAAKVRFSDPGGGFSGQYFHHDNNTVVKCVGADVGIGPKASQSSRRGRCEKSNHFSDVGTLRKYASGIFLVPISAAMPP